MRRSKSSNVVKVKSSIRNRIIKKSSSTFNVEDNFDTPENFQNFFTESCLANKVKVKFKILCVSLSSLSIQNVENKQKGNTIFVETDSYDVRKTDPSGMDCESQKEKNVLLVTSKVDKKDVIVNIYFKNVKTDNAVIHALDSSLPHQQNLELLSFVNCNLGVQEIISMKNILAKYPNITELNIERNPFSGDNMSILLGKTSSLKCLTLRFCQINDNCVKGIAKELKRVPSLFQILDLSSNYITDLGCQYLTNALRINRSLIVLNLSNNFLTDQSCVYFRSALEKFELTPNEIKMKRQEHFNRLLLRRNLTQKFIETTTEQFDVKSQRAKSPKRRSASSGRKESSSNKPTESEREKYINANMPKITHPFIVDVQAIDGSIFCHGNFQLAHLNLGCNLQQFFSILVNSTSATINHCKFSPRGFEL